MKEGQRITKATYNDPDIVSGYVEAHKDSKRLDKEIKEFADSLPGKRVIDVGCGPGYYSHQLSKHGLFTVGVDYSFGMAQVTKNHVKEGDNIPAILAGDMRDIGRMFKKDSFDGAWVLASIFHISEKYTPKVLQGIHEIVVSGGKVYIGLKAGKQGARIVEEEKYGKPMLREFTFWEKDNFLNLAKENGFIVEKVTENVIKKNSHEETKWLNYWLKVKK